MVSKDQTVALVLCAGSGTRMHSEIPKVLHLLGGLPLVGHVVSSLKSLDIKDIGCVIGPFMEELKNFVSPVPCFIQEKPLGTAHAVLAARSFFEHRREGSLLVLFGDTPLLSSHTFEKLLRSHKTSKAAVTLLSMIVKEPNAYGRLMMEKDGSCTRIIEAKDATPLELEITTCNSGVMVLDLKTALSLLEEVDSQNASQEYYLVDCVEIAVRKGLKVSVCNASKEEVVGINTREDLANAEEIFQKHRRKAFFEKGVTFLDPNSVYLSHDTELAPDVIIEPHVYFGPQVQVAKKARIRSFSYLEGVNVGENTKIGPFARLRPGTELMENVQIGNFVEIKNSLLSKDVKVNHLSYVGDAEIGQGSNIGAGTITCNYDGISKHRTQIGEKVFIGSNTALVAPLQIGDGAFIGAGSVITQNVEKGAFAVSRSSQKQISDGAERIQARAKMRRKN